MSRQTTVHATCVALNKKGVLLRGKSGIGKSDLALRLLDAGGILVSDDQVIVTVWNERLTASPPETLAGKLEIRGVGICEFPFVNECTVYAVVDLTHDFLPERLPDLENQKQTILDIELTGFLLDPRQASAVAKIQAMLQLVE